MAVAEICTFYGKKNVTTSQKYVFVKNSSLKNTKRLYEKLALTKLAYEILFSCTHKQVEKEIKKQNWNKIISGTFCVRSSFDEQKFAGIIWDQLKKPHVDLQNPTTLIHFFIISKKVFVAKQLWKNPNIFFERKAQHRPGFYPASLHPQLALAMVNLSGVVSNTKIIIDPFCGTGGILIECALSGRKCAGYDINAWMLKKCKENLKHYKIKNTLVKQGNATRFHKKCAAIVTELPFGKNTKSQDLILLYTKFLKNAAQNTKRVVVSFPDFVDYKKLVKKSKWEIKESFLWYLHSSMSKEIVVLDN